MDSVVVWKGGLSFEASREASGFSVPLGAGPADDGFRPMELLLTALAGCTGMDVISILQKKRQVVTAFEVRVHGDRAENHPKVYTRITVEYAVTGRKVEREAVGRAVELSETKYCSVMAMLRRAAPIETKITVSETAP
jgi:putative redox protein